MAQMVQMVQMAFKCLGPIIETQPFFKRIAVFPLAAK